MGNKKERAEAIKFQTELYLAKHRITHPHMPEYARKAPRYSDRTSSGLIKIIIDFLRLSGHTVERANNPGRYSDTREVFTDVVGRTRQIGSAKWRPEARQMKADILTEINGRQIAIITHSTDITPEPGIWVVEDFADFLLKYRGVSSSLPIR
jgi:hypothetical protein